MSVPLPPFEESAPPRRRWRDSALFKMLVTGVLTLALLIPLVLVSSLVSERRARRDEAFREVAATWGNRQTVGGPVLSVPFRVRSTDEQGKASEWIETAHFLPETLAVTGEVVPEKRSRGIFEVVLYRSDLRFRATIARPDFAPWPVAPQDILWDSAYLSVSVPDLRGVRRAVQVRWDGRALPLEPTGGEGDLWTSGLRVSVPGLAAEPAGRVHEVAFDLALNGSESLRFLPLGSQTSVTLKSAWPSPSFSGGFLPERRQVSAAGFQAVWNVAFFARGYPQRFRASETQALTAAREASAFGVDLILPADGYQKTERSVKYGILFLLLTFLTFFLYEQFSPVVLHPVQYLLVGAALCLFYLLLLSLSEHLAFAFAYGVAAAATVLLIGGYSWAILKGKGRALLLTGILGALYGYLYVLLQAEDYALLLGSVGLFAILALVMYLTRKVQWT